jgi:hypothetical protein
VIQEARIGGVSTNTICDMGQLLGTVRDWISHRHADSHDHSAFDAYMLLVEGARKRLPYIGDFRRRGPDTTLDRRRGERARDGATGER